MGIHHLQAVQYQIAGQHGHLERHEHEHDVQRKQNPAEPERVDRKRPCCRHRDQKLAQKDTHRNFHGIPEDDEKLRRLKQNFAVMRKRRISREKPPCNQFFRIRHQRAEAFLQLIAAQNRTAQKKQDGRTEKQPHQKKQPLCRRFLHYFFPHDRYPFSS